MSSIAIGDVHGNLRALIDLLNRIIPQICIGDTIVFLGDYIDRGPDTKDCLDHILSFQSQMSARTITLLGNHEQWLMRTYEDHTSHSWLLGMEAFETIRSYSPSAEETLRKEAERHALELITGRVSLPYEVFFEAVPREHIEFFKNLRTFCRTPDAVCVHGGMSTEGGRVEEQRPDDLIWGTDNFPEAYKGQDSVVYGHTGNPLVDDRGWPHPRIVGRTYEIDTISKGVLTALKLPQNTIIQSDQFD